MRGAACPSSVLERVCAGGGSGSAGGAECVRSVVDGVRAPRSSHHARCSSVSVSGPLTLCGGVSECARIPSGWMSAALALYSAFPYVDVLFLLILISSQSSPWDTRPGKCDADGPAMDAKKLKAKKLNAQTLNVGCLSRPGR